MSGIVPRRAVFAIEWWLCLPSNTPGRGTRTGRVPGAFPAPRVLHQPSAQQGQRSWSPPSVFRHVLFWQLLRPPGAIRSTSTQASEPRTGQKRSSRGRRQTGRQKPGGKSGGGGGGGGRGGTSGKHSPTKRIHDASPQQMLYQRSSRFSEIAHALFEKMERDYQRDGFASGGDVRGIDTFRFRVLYPYSTRNPCPC